MTVDNYCAIEIESGLSSCFTINLLVVQNFMKILYTTLRKHHGNSTHISENAKINPSVVDLDSSKKWVLRHK